MYFCWEIWRPLRSPDRGADRFNQDEDGHLKVAATKAGVPA
jgi:hypothetical protein